MKGEPTVLWTCDRCGVSTQTALHELPSQWWTWDRARVEGRYRQAEDGHAPEQYVVCDACDSSVTDDISFGGKATND